MKKGLLLLLMIVIAAFAMHGCYTGKSNLNRDNGYPAGHDMHLDSESNFHQDKLKNQAPEHPLGAYS